jgi:redox-sensitive bicupin YhaK (pirin superfamily)
MTASDCTEHPGTRPVERVIVPRRRELAPGFAVRRALPSVHRRTVGPFIFLDHMGPVTFDAGRGLDVAPHPHIGLTTLTYLFEGVILHRDSLGVVQPIHPGAANWMTAGRGIAHSERTPPEARTAGSRTHGVQCWLALPKTLEDTDPSFVHHPAEALPLVEGDGLRARIIGGTLFGARAPAETATPLFFADVTLDAGARLAVPPDHEERALYVVEGTMACGGHDADVTHTVGELLVLVPHMEAVFTATTSARVVLLGGAPLDGPRHIWWNFVHSSRDRIEQAKDDWRHRRFAPVPGDDARIPLPGEPEPVVRYP